MTDHPTIVAILDQLRPYPGIVGVVAFGSLARNELSQTSDIDLLVVRTDESRVDELRSLIERAARASPFKRVTPIFFTSGTLAREFSRHPSFAAHIADEGVVLYRDASFSVVERALHSTEISHEALERELHTRIQALRLFSDPERLNGRYIPSLARLYSIGRAVVIVKLLQHNVHEYSWRRVFEAYSAIRPELSDDIARVKSLRACYEHVHNRRSAVPDEWDKVSPQRFIDTVESVSTLAAA